MSVTLARRIRRIGILPIHKHEDGTIHRHERLELAPADLDAEVVKLRAEYKAKRIAARKTFLPPKSTYRRSKSRRKAVDSKKAA